MSQSRQNDTTSSSLSAESAPADSLAVGLSFMLAVTVIQRLVGFTRSILFCGMLQDDQLGRWSLAFSFLVLAGPLTLLGLPGSFGRYVEYYRQRDQLGTFLRRTISVSVVLAITGILVVLLTARFWAWLVFGDTTLAPLMQLLGLTLAAVIAFNFVTELLTSVRQMRAVAMMQFVCSLLFALLGIGLLYFTNLAEKAIIIAFGVASLAATLIAIRPLRRIGREAVACRADLSHGQLWRKLLPFAAWIWVTNLLANLFDIADRLMIVHFARADQVAADALVGQYHSSRVVPYLLVSVAGMVAAVVLPYMSHDWERGDRRSVARRQLLTLKLTGIVFTFLGALILLGSPLLFTWLLRGKYDQGLAVLPWTLTYCIWLSLTTLGTNYLWCAEKARLGSLALLFGLLVNIGLNMVLLPYWGLAGAVLATAIANAIALVAVLYFAHLRGLALDPAVLMCCALPITIVLGPAVALAALLAISYVGMKRKWLFNEAEQRELMATAGQLWQRVRSKQIEQSLDYS